MSYDYMLQNAITIAVIGFMIYFAYAKIPALTKLVDDTIEKIKKQ